MDFSWFGVTIINIGVLSFSGAGFVWLFRRIASLEKQIVSLNQEILSLNQENNTLRFRIETLEEENRDLEKKFDILSGRYAEIKEMHEKLSDAKSNSQDAF